MAATSAERKAKRTALAREARRLADEVESLFIQLAECGALAVIQRYMICHSEGNPTLDLLHTAKALRAYAGTLTLLSSLSKPVSAAGKPQ
jgi:hypothetical protein